MNDYYRSLIANEFRNCITNTIRRISNNEQTHHPFHTALLPEDAIFWSAFERSFSTSLGQRVIEEVAKLVALSNGAEKASRQIKTQIRIDIAYDEAILEHIQALREHRITHYDWVTTYSQIRNTTPIGRTKDIIITSDMWWKKNSIDNYISLKTVKPDIDQTLVAKKDCLRLKIAKPNCNVYFGLPYNPYGENKNDYAHKPPMGIFDFHNDSVVLIGKEMWDTIGGTGCYEELLAIATEVGEETRPIIERLR